MLQHLIAIVLAGAITLMQASPLTPSNSTILSASYPFREPHTINECFSSRRLPNLRPVHDRSCRILIAYLYDGPLSNEPRQWMRGKVAAFHIPEADGCRITLTPHRSKEQWQQTMTMTTRQIAAVAAWTMDQCTARSQWYDYGGRLSFEYSGFSASLLVVNLKDNNVVDQSLVEN